MVTGYKDIVLSVFPYLIFLDGTEISKSDRYLAENFLEGVNSAALFFTCVNLAGLPKPPKGEKNSKQTIHVEITMPLFQEDTKEVDDTAKEREAEKDKHKVKKRNIKSKGIKINLYNKDDEYNPKIKNNSFETQRKTWAKTMNYSPILLKSPENNLEAYRDSFRSSVNVRIIYLKVQTPKKTSKEQKDKKKKNNYKKSKKQDKRDKKRSSDKSSKSNKKSKNTKSEKKRSEKTTYESSTSDVNKEKSVEKIKEEQQETILKKITLASFYCDLFSINWKDSCINFYWSEDPKLENKAVEYNSYLEELVKEKEEKNKNILEKKNVKQQGSKKDKKFKKSDKSKRSKASKKSKGSKNKLKNNEKYMSCQVSFGMWRIGKNIKEDKSDIKKNKKNKKDKKSKI